jgi:hypothetical protein
MEIGGGNVTDWESRDSIDTGRFMLMPQTTWRAIPSARLR